MRSKLIVIAALAAALAVLLGGCGAISFNSAENLIRPPKLSGDDGELQSSFEKAVSDRGEYILKSPSAGDYRSAFVRRDCDNDGEDEAFVFYSLKSESMLVYMYILDCVDGEWTPLGESQGEGSDIYSIEFCDLNSDGMEEILVGWSSLDAKTNKKLSVYCAYDADGSEHDYKVIAIESYTSMYTADLDDDGEKEILLTLINSTSDTYTTEARLLKMTREKNSEVKMSAVGQASLYSEITAITGITSGMSDGRRCVYIDEAAGSTYLTEILYWDNERSALTLPIQVDVLSVSSCPTSRSVSLVCDDIDSDGEIEIPSTSLLQDSGVVRKVTPDSAGNTDTVYPENIYILKWSKYSGNEFTLVGSFIDNPYDEFRIKFDEEKMRFWSATYYPDEHLSQFFMLKKSDDPGEAGERQLLFEISAVDYSETVSIGSYLMTGESYKYTFEITEDGENAGITKSYIASVFTPYED